MRNYLSAAVIACAFPVLPALAQTTVGPGGTNLPGYQIGSDRGFIGQTFTSPGGLLTDFDYTSSYGDGGSTRFVVTTFDDGTFGQPLFSRLVTIGDGSTRISGINLSIAASSIYVAYLTNIGVENAARVIGIGAHYPQFGIPFVNAYEGGDATAYEVTSDPAGGTSFQADTFSDVAFTATFAPGTSAVPEPASWAMMTLGFGALGFAMRRKKTVTRIRFA